MSIKIECSCGKKLSVKDEFVGRRIFINRRGRLQHLLNCFIDIGSANHDCLYNTTDAITARRKSLSKALDPIVL